MICLRKISTVIILFGSLCVNTFGSEASSNKCVEEQLLVLLTKWRQGDDNSIPLPPLKLISIPSYEGEYAGYGLAISFITGNMKLIGADGFTIEALSVTTSEVFIASGLVRFPLLSLTSDYYSIKGRAFGLYTLKGAGSMRIAFDNVLVPFNVSLGPKEEGSHIEDLNLDFTLDDVRVDLANSSWPINRILNAQGLDIIMSYRNEIDKLASDTLKSIFDKYLAFVTPKQLISTFIGSCNNVNIM